MHRGDGGRASDDLNLRALHFCGGLRLVAAVGEQARGAARNGERGAGAGESGKIANIGKMGDKETGEPGFCDAAAKQPDSACVVHPERYIREQLPAPSSELLDRVLKLESADRS